MKGWKTGDKLLFITCFLLILVLEWGTLNIVIFMWGKNESLMGIRFLRGGFFEK